MSNPGLKVSDLLNLQQSIERDLDELNETLKRIPSDRDYSSGIQNSIENEIFKLGELQKELLDIEISIEDPFADTQKIEKVILPEKPSSENPEIITNPVKSPVLEGQKLKTPRRY